MKRLVLIRHGESAWNVERRIQGQSGSRLSDRGRQQAKHTAAWVVESYGGARLVTSDLQRCLETTAPIAAALGREPVTEQGVRERDFGRWTGKLVTEVAELDPAIWRRWTAGDDVVAEVGGEGTADFSARVIEAYDRILLDTPDDGVTVCVTHGGPVWHGTRRLLDLPMNALGGVGNASVTEIAFDDTWGRRLIVWNQGAHLPVDLRSWPHAADAADVEDDDAPTVGE
ncbi:MAG: histidine phosphatase family protein [Actinobacteria bacterium]|nr:histidine phosphatase family protein [Actinomycetota bacterium]